MHRRTFLIHSIAAFTVTAFAGAQTPGQATAPLRSDPALKGKAGAAIEKGLGFLKKQQKQDGSWSSGDYPAMTALCVMSFQRAGASHGHSQPVRTGLDFIRKHAQPDGGIYTKGMGNYNTSICLTALLLAGESRDGKIVDAARAYLVGGQVKNSANPAHDGGHGYEAGATADSKPRRPDLDNTVFTLEALRLYRDTHRTKETAPDKDLNWEAALAFVSRCQNLPATNPEKWASDDAENKGGFIYSPGDSPAGEMQTADGKKALRSYGTMTYAGLLSLIYADVKKDDARVTAAQDWLQRHFTLEENPGQGAQGLFYYYHVMAKALSAAGVDELTLPDGKRVNWRAELAGKLLALQKPDGSWVSENGRWMEKDPVLVTCYATLALDLIQQKL